MKMCSRQCSLEFCDQIYLTNTDSLVRLDTWQTCHYGLARFPGTEFMSHLSTTSIFFSNFFLRLDRDVSAVFLINNLTLKYRFNHDTSFRKNELHFLQILRRAFPFSDMWISSSVTIDVILKNYHDWWHLWASMVLLWDILWFRANVRSMIVVLFLMRFLSTFLAYTFVTFNSVGRHILSFW